MAWPKIFRQPATQQAAERGWEEIPNTPRPALSQPAWMDDEDEENSASGWWIGIIVCAIYAIAVFVFAWQTWQLVNTIFPADNQFMKISTVCCLDVMSLVFAMAEMLYPFKSAHAKHLAMGMWLITFTGALSASIIYMYLNSISVLHGVVDMSILVWAYAIVVVVMAADVLSITVGIRMEVGAAKAARRRARFIRRQQAQAQVYSQVSPANNQPSQEMLNLFAQLLQLQEGGRQTDQVPLVSRSQNSGSMPKQAASARRAKEEDKTQTP